MEPTTFLPAGFSYTTAAFRPYQVLYPCGYSPHFEEPPPAPTNRNLILEHTEKLRMMLVYIAHQLYQLNLAEQNIRRSIEYHCAVVAPIRRLPADVLIENFGHCLQAESDPVSPLSNRTVSCTLSYVCRRWRSVVLSTPLLWPRRMTVAVVGESDMHIGHPTSVLPIGAIDLLGLHLDRSYPLPLEIWLIWRIPRKSHCKYDQYQQWDPVEIFRRVFQHADRFTGLHLTFNSASSDPVPNPLLRLPTGRPIMFPQLTFVHIDDWLEYSDTMPRWLASALRGAPNLREFRAIQSSLMLGLAPPEVILPFLPQITILYLGTNMNVLPCTALSILAVTPNLEECKLFINSEYGPATDPLPAKLTLPHLRVFHATNDYDFTTDLEFFSRLILPSLEELLLHNDNRPSCVRRLIARSHCAISSLTLYLDPDDLDEVDEMAVLLHELPALQTLKLISACPGPLLEALVTRHGGDIKPTATCPNLHCLQLTGVPADKHSPIDDWITLITELVQSRSAITSDLKVKFQLYVDEDAAHLP